VGLAFELVLNDLIRGWALDEWLIVFACLESFSLSVKNYGYWVKYLIDELVKVWSCIVIK